MSAADVNPMTALRLAHERAHKSYLVAREGWEWAKAWRKDEDEAWAKVEARWRGRRDARAAMEAHLASVQAEHAAIMAATAAPARP